MTEGRQEKLNPDGSEPTKGQLALDECVILTGYVGMFGENNTAGELIEKEGLVLRPPKWFGTELSKDEKGILVVVAVPKGDMPKATPDLNVGALEREVAELKAQLDLPLTSGNITMLRDLLGEQKTKAADRVKRDHEDDLLDKLDGYLNPTLPFDKEEPEEGSEVEEGGNAEGPTDPEADTDDTEE